jgi:hypothetical protein
MSVLRGKALAEVIPRRVTGYQARSMFGDLTRSLGNAYQTLAEYQSTGAIGVIVPALAAVKFALTRDAINAAKQYLDSTNDMLKKYYAQMPESNATLTDLQFQQLQASVYGTSIAVSEIDQLFTTPWSAELADDIINAAGTVSAWIAGKTSQVVGDVLGSILGKTWWILLLGAGGVWIYYRVAGKVTKRLAERI